MLSPLRTVLLALAAVAESGCDSKPMPPYVTPPQTEIQTPRPPNGQAGQTHEQTLPRQP